MVNKITNFLKCELERMFKDDNNQTLVYYQSKSLNHILEIKNGPIKYVPKNSSFKEALKKAKNSIEMSKSKLSKNLS
ncbi:hypothetical protein BpHYR1_008040 [Brachionus plicatilis]|uniref:Uncharacterized protein n=1 Tax=Brachionus plicatilis TaxID=10195 RepID=A0A3M7PGA7_BRAPC|nr:hypothetical protein BpHYR1_008040 [Brachionus plicatilis]